MLGVLYSANLNLEWIQYATSQAKEIGLRLHGKALKNSNDINKHTSGNFPSMNAIWLVPDPIISENANNELQIFKKYLDLAKNNFCLQSSIHCQS